jgi:hypothetical protein
MRRLVPVSTDAPFVMRQANACRGMAPLRTSLTPAPCTPCGCCTINRALLHVCACDIHRTTSKHGHHLQKLHPSIATMNIKLVLLLLVACVQPSWAADRTLTSALLEALVLPLVSHVYRFVHCKVIHARRRRQLLCFGCCSPTNIVIQHQLHGHVHRTTQATIQVALASFVACQSVC